MDRITGVDTPIPPFGIDAAAANGALPRRISDRKKPQGPAMPGEALMQGPLVPNLIVQVRA